MIKAIIMASLCFQILGGLAINTTPHSDEVRNLCFHRGDSIIKNGICQTLNSKLLELRIIITAKIIDSFQNLSYIGELRQRWGEIKKLQLNPIIKLQDIANTF